MIYAVIRAMERRVGCAFRLIKEEYEDHKRGNTVKV